VTSLKLEKLLISIFKKVLKVTKNGSTSEGRELPASGCSIPWRGKEREPPLRDGEMMYK
jgi:hypothetical protein